MKKFELGDSYEMKKFVSEEDVLLFAKLSGDFNPIHIDEEKAKNSIFKTRIVHGLLLASYISTILGMYMPGQGTIYKQQDLQFLKPVKINTEIRILVKVSEIINQEKNIYKLETSVINESDEVAVLGYAVIKYMGEEVFLCS